MRRRITIVVFTAAADFICIAHTKKLLRFSSISPQLSWPHEHNCRVVVVLDDRATEARAAGRADGLGRVLAGAGGDEADVGPGAE